MSFINCLFILLFIESNSPNKMLAPPKITSISGTILGYKTSYDENKFLGYIIGDTESSVKSQLKIKGSGFGNSKGAVQITGVNSYSITNIESWSDAIIVVTFKANFKSEPTEKAIISVKPAGNNSTSVSFNIGKLVPAIASRQYGECTWWASKRRKENGKSIPKIGAAYSDSNWKPIINTTYFPKVMDLWCWTTKHQAYVEKIDSSVMCVTKNPYKEKVIYSISVSESNADNKGTINVWSFPKVEYDIIYNDSTKKVIIKRERKSGKYESSISNFGDASHYFR